jgi:hypothetical protein
MTHESLTECCKLQHARSNLLLLEQSQHGMFCTAGAQTLPKVWSPPAHANASRLFFCGSTGGAQLYWLTTHDSAGRTQLPGA